MATTTTTTTKSKGTVLITGLNGYIAGVIALAFIKAGYSVRGTVRSLASAKPIVDFFSSHQFSHQISVIEVPDITLASAFDEAVKGVTHIAHLASPVAISFEDSAAVVEAATLGALRVLESAHKESGVKSVVFMSSIAAVRGPNRDLDGEGHSTYTYTEKDWNETSQKEVEKHGKDSGFHVYEYSKTAAERAVWNFRTTFKPSFSITSINPTFVAGPPLLTPSSPSEIHLTTKAIYLIAAGFSPLSQVAIPSIIPNTGHIDAYVDVRDVARAVLWASDVENTEKADGERYILCAWYAPPQAVADILRSKIPERQQIIERGEPGKGYEPDYTFPKNFRESWDGSKFVRATGQEYIPWEKTVLDTYEHFKGLL
ncbi:hypothetical protein QBC43DRAFT_359426 [Cladorrhinum sp. PSN259]|nr:hypothetical protein QBC43DRAFT_359426 [Cladorrhinum sp. PSN259]